MPMTVITLRNVPQSLRGDITRWMQEVATGVYVGNFNSRVRAYLWHRVQETMGSGEASMCYAARNELGYDFAVENASRKVLDYDGIPLIFVPKKPVEKNSLAKGFSKAAKYHHAHVATGKKKKEKPDCYIVIDIETDGLDEKKNHILEIGAVRSDHGKETYFTEVIAGSTPIPANITELTGITEQLRQDEGKEESKVLGAFRAFIGNDDLVGYHVSFDIGFLSKAFAKYGLGRLENHTHDILRAVKKEQPFQENYKLETSLQTYGIKEKVLHRALQDAIAIHRLAQKLKKF